MQLKSESRRKPGCYCVPGKKAPIILYKTCGLAQEEMKVQLESFTVCLISVLSHSFAHTVGCIAPYCLCICFSFLCLSIKGAVLHFEKAYSLFCEEFNEKINTIVMFVH